MPGDVILNGQDVRVTTQQLQLSYEDAGPDKSVAVNLGNETAGAWHISGPRAEEGTPLSIFWWKLKKTYMGPFLSVFVDGRVKLGNPGVGLTVDPAGRAGLGTENPRSTLHVHGSEVMTTGPVAGYSFSDREVKTESGEDAQQRWVWYASGKAARLWAGQDKLTVRASGDVEVGGVTVGDNTIYLSGLGWKTPATEVHGFPVPAIDMTGKNDFTDLTKVIQDLQKRVQELENNLAKLQTA